MRSIACAALVVAGCGSEAVSCLIDDVVAREEAGATPMSCGTLAVGASVAEMTAAHDCVLAAQAAHRTFALQWDVMGIDSHVARAYLGLDTGIEHLRYDGSPGGSGLDNNPITHVTTCTSIADLGDCGGDRPISLCLACTGEAAKSSCP